MKRNQTRRCWGRSLSASIVGVAISIGGSGCALMEKIPPLPTAENQRKAEMQKMSLARLSEEKGNYADAKHIYTEMLKKNPDHADAHRRLAVIATRENKFAEADEHFHKAWQIGPQTAGLATDMGYRLYLEHRLAEAEQMLRKAIEIEPQHQTAHNNLGLVLGQMGRIDEAMACFVKVNKEAEAHANLAHVLTQIGRIEEAKREYSIALSQDPNMRSAANGLLALTGNLRPLSNQPLGPNPNGPSPQPAPIVAGNSTPLTSAQPALPPQPVSANGGWQPLQVVEQRVPVNPQAPSTTLSWNGPQPTVQDLPQGALPPGTPPAGYVAAGQQLPGANAAQPVAYATPTNTPPQPAAQQTLYQGPPAPYGGAQATPRTPSYAGPESYPMQFSNGISPQAGPPGTISR